MTEPIQPFHIELIGGPHCGHTVDSFGLPTQLSMRDENGFLTSYIRERNFKYELSGDTRVCFYFEPLVKTAKKEEV